MSWEVTTPNSTLPITRDEAKLHLKVDTTADDSLIDGLRAAAKNAAENHLNRYLYNTTITEYFDCFPSSASNNPDAHLFLGVGGVSSVTSIQYQDTDDATQTFLSDDWVLDNSVSPARIALANGKTWPSTLNEIKAVTVTYVVGYGATAGTEPEVIKQACYLMLTDWYHKRGDSVRKMPTASEFLLNQERIQVY